MIARSFSMQKFYKYPHKFDPGNVISSFLKSSDSRLCLICRCLIDTFESMNGMEKTAIGASPKRRGHGQGLGHGANIMDTHDGGTSLCAATGHRCGSPDASSRLRLIQHSTDEAFSGWTN